MNPSRLPSFLLLLLALLALAAGGCSSTEPDNASARPWNSPQGWESGGGLPSSIMQGR